MKHEMKLLAKPFKEILDGSKTVEFILNDEKRKKIKIGDTIEFSKLPDLTEKITVEVLELYQYPTFKDLLLFLGYKDEELTNKLQGIYSIYTIEEEKEQGVLGIKIKLLNNK